MNLKLLIEYVVEIKAKFLSCMRMERLRLFFGVLSLDFKFEMQRSMHLYFCIKTKGF